MKGKKIFVNNGNTISTPNKNQMKNQSNYNNNTNLQEENNRLKIQISQKNKELQEYKKTYESLQRQLNTLKRNSANKNNYKNNNYNYSNSNNYKSNNYNYSNRNNSNNYNINISNRINTNNNLNDSFGFNDPFFNNFFTEITDSKTLENLTKTKLPNLVELNILDNVTILQHRNDVSSLLQMADIFLMPSLYEGLSVAAVEAQASGILCLCSDNVDRNVNITGLCKFLPLDIDTWVEQMNCNIDNRNSKKDDIIKAGFDVKTTAKWLEDFYKEIV